MSARKLAVWAAVGAMSVAALAGCGGSSSSNNSSGSGNQGNLAGTPAADTFNAGTPQHGGKVTWTIEKTMQNWNILSAAGDTFDYSQVINGLYPAAFITNPSYKITLNSDLLTSATQTSTNPQTIVYQINPKAVWSDGTPITSDDFNYTWEVQNGTDANIPIAGAPGYNLVKSITGSNNGKTMTMVFSSVFPDWKSMFNYIYPAHVAAQHGNNEQSFAWFSNNVPTVSGGPFVVSSVSSDKTSVILARNTKYYGPLSPLDQVVFRAITDQSQEPTALQNHEVDGIYPQPTLDLVTQLKNMGNTITYKIDSGLEFEHIDFNLKNAALGNATWGTTLRTAMFTALNRNELLSKTIQQFQASAVPLNSRMLVPGQPGYQDNVTQFGLGTGNLAAAQKLLTSAGFTGAAAGQKLTAPGGAAVPAFKMVYTVGNTIRQNTCELFAAAMANLGITVNVVPTDNLGATLTQTGAGYSYDIVVFAWVATPFPASANQPLYVTGGGSNYGAYTNPTVDSALNAALSSTDTNTQITNLNKADQQISKDAYTLPLYQKPVLIAFWPNLVNVRINATSTGPTYNVGQWGLKAS